jgi:predicted anti-sigma-YlaC factor YlaD
MTDWDAELKKIDKQLESMSDSALIPAPAKGAPPAAKAQVAAERATTRTWGAFLRLALATALGVGILFWPYAHRCGAGLAGYLIAISAIVAGGVWSSVWTWRHRTARAHVLSLLLVLWGLVLGAIELLPRSGYAMPDADRPLGWTCDAAPASILRAPAGAP